MRTQEGGCDNTPDWYWPTWASAANLPTFVVRDTESSHGRYASQTKCITLKDLVKFHGHACDGLFRGAVALSRALASLFPNGVVNRTDLRVLSRNSPCLGDVAAYLTGGRIRFGTQDVRDELGVWYVVQRITTGEAVRVTERAGLYPSQLAATEAELVARRQAHPTELDRLREAQWNWVRDVLLREDWLQAYAVTELPAYVWEPVPYERVGVRTDILFKSTATIPHGANETEGP
jgi:formylmethanofuran dehydrogenase subunit E